MKKKNVKVVLLLLVILGAIIATIYLINKDEDPYFTEVRVSDVDFRNTKILDLNKNELSAFYEDIINYLNKEKYNYYKVITFKKVIEDDNKYIYFSLNNEFETLIECKYDPSNNKFYWSGDTLDTSQTTHYTKKTYLEIMNPKKYKKEKELDEMEKAKPDDNDQATMDPKDGVSE
ncbi:MAG: hypothetical protein IKG58_04035 [Bacilli bacterium]|nr:hypothetical protein [Bacilli bacterium]